MEGLYLYCIRERIDTSSPIPTNGIDGKGEVFVIPFRELEAVVSRVSLEEFASEEIQKKAQEDLSWIKEKALAHERVIEEVLRKDDKVLSLVPMRFGAIFKDKERLEETLDKDYSGLMEVLERIKGKQEWSVKIYLKDRGKLEQVIKEKNEFIIEKEKEISSLPEGMAFFMEEELIEFISRELEKELDNVVEEFFERLGKHAVDLKRCKVLEKELTGKRDPMVLNAAYLISEEKIEDFKKEVQGLTQEIQANGFYLEYSGPWSAYNFTTY